jgi:hypothetical protein
MGSTERTNIRLSDERLLLLDRAEDIVAGGEHDDPPTSDVIATALTHLIGSRDDLFGSLPTIESIGKTPDLFCHPDALAEELLVAEIAVLRAEKPDPVTEFDQYLCVLFDYVARFSGSFTESVDLFTRIAHSDSQAGNLCQLC